MKKSGNANFCVGLVIAGNNWMLKSQWCDSALEKRGRETVGVRLLWHPPNFLFDRMYVGNAQEYKPRTNYRRVGG